MSRRETTSLHDTREALSHTHPLGSWRLVRGYRLPLAAAFLAMVVESAAGLWEPWPLKLIFDEVIGRKPVSPAIAHWSPFGTAPLDLLNTAVAALIAIAVIGALASYVEKYLSTSVGQRVMHDLGTRHSPGSPKFNDSEPTQLKMHLQAIAVSGVETRYGAK